MSKDSKWVEMSWDEEWTWTRPFCVFHMNLDWPQLDSSELSYKLGQSILGQIFSYELMKFDIPLFIYAHSPHQTWQTLIKVCQSVRGEKNLN